MKNLSKIVSVFAGIFLFPLLTLFAQTPAFPGAEGCGKFTTGGRGGTVVKVTNLNDSGVGSLRYALESLSGPRTVIFTVSGTIELESTLKIEHGDVTIAGQTAPGNGICIKNYQVRLDADNVIIRFIRFRLGDETQTEHDSFWGRERENIIIDHCSMSWSIDECGSFYDNENFTMQWCILSESLWHSFHPKGPHGYGGIWGGKQATFHHNLLAHHTSRNPRFNGARYTTTIENEVVDFVNNVLYNWSDNSAYGGENGNVNMRFNYYKPGPATASDVADRIIEPYDGTGNWYLEGNFVEGSEEVTSDNSLGVRGSYAAVQRARLSETPFEVTDIEMETAEEAFANVVMYAGASFPARDAVDARILQEAATGTVNYGANGIIDSQTEVGGYPYLGSYEAPLDSDNDGMPDEWEVSNNLDPNLTEDGNYLTEDGYTMLEKYLNSLVTGEITGVKDNPSVLPGDFNIVGNYPNPFNSSTLISYVLPEAGNVDVKIYSTTGEMVKNLYTGFNPAGRNTIEWNSLTSNYKPVTSGVYVVVVKYQGKQKTHKLLLLK